MPKKKKRAAARAKLRKRMGSLKSAVMGLKVGKAKVTVGKPTIVSRGKKKRKKYARNPY